MTVRRLLLLTLVALAIGATLAACQLVGGRGRIYENAFVEDSTGHKEILVAWGDGDYHAVTCNEYDDDDPALSSDGRRLAFASDRSGDWEIYLLGGGCIGPDFTEASVVRLTVAPGVDRNPAWSPDGKPWRLNRSAPAWRRFLWIAMGQTNDSSRSGGGCHAPAWSLDDRARFMLDRSPAVRSTL